MYNVGIKYPYIKIDAMLKESISFIFFLPTIFHPTNGHGRHYTHRYY